MISVVNSFLEVSYGYAWWWLVRLLRATDEKPKVTWDLLKRVLRYSRPYRWQIAGMLVLILLTTGLALLTPLIFRNLIDMTIPSGNVQQLVLLALLLLLIPAFNGVINVFQRRLNAAVGEGVIYDLRVALYAHLQRMSLRFFTNTKIGELMSRLNNDVVGAQNAISNTIVNIITNLIQAVAVLVVMLTLEWRLTMISVIILPLFILAARQLGDAPARYLPPADGSQRGDERHDERDAQHRRRAAGEALRAAPVEVERFEERAGVVRDIGVRRAVVGAIFFVIIGLVSAVGTALVYGIGGYLVIQNAFTIGTIVAFGAYLTSLIRALQRAGQCPGRFCHLDGQLRARLRSDRSAGGNQEKAGRPGVARGARRAGLRRCLFPYDIDEENLLSEVQRFGRWTASKRCCRGRA